MNDPLEKIAVITGASRGIGHATACLFLERGWRIITCSRDQISVDRKRYPNWIIHISSDLTNPSSIDEFIEKVNSVIEGKELHGLVNNAGISPKTEYKERLGCLNGNIDAWHNVFELNFFAPLKLSRGFAWHCTKEKAQSLM